MTTSGNASGMAALQNTNQEDIDLLARVGLGDQRAMASLYDRHSTLVYSVALRVCCDSALAEEVVQNIFMQMWLP
jgi:RNA polymerase sigma-70 factor (ECF subfamily)